MIELLIMLAFLTALFWLEFHVTGALLSAMIHWASLMTKPMECGETTRKHP